MPEIFCESRIAEVAVYARGAVVTRAVAIPPDLPGDAVDLAVRGVSPLAEAGSVRASLEGDRQVVALKTRLAIPPSPAGPGEILARLRSLALDREHLRA